MKRIGIGIIAGELGMLALCLVVFWCAVSGADAMGYAILFTWLLMPAASFATSFVVGLRRVWGPRGILWPIACAVAVMLLPWLTFSLAYILHSGRFDSPDLSMLVWGLVVSFAGYGLGVAARSFRKKAGRASD